MSSQVNKNRALAGSVVSETNPITVWYNLFIFFESGTWDVTSSYFALFRGQNSGNEKYGANMLALINLFWETGLFGVIVYITFYFFFFIDTLLLMKNDDIFGSFALGWNAVVLIICFSLIYKNIFVSNAIIFLFWYFNGIVAAKIFRKRILLDNLSENLIGQSHGL